MARSYLNLIFGFLAVCAVSLATFNWLVNPFSLYAGPIIDRFNKDKTEYLKYLRLTKAYRIYWDRPDCIILGTSRSGRGLSPAHPAWGDCQVYNLAVPSSGMYENFRLLQHANSAKPLRRVLLGLDFRMFNKISVNPAFSEDRMLVAPDGSPNPDYPSTSTKDLLSTLISSTAIQASLNTVRFQGWNADALFSNGRWDRTRMPYDHRAAFTAYTKSSIKHYSQIAGSVQGLDHYRKLLDLAHREGIELHLLISPSHATHWVLLERLGLWSRFEQLKRDLVRINRSASAQAGKPPFPIWDFSGINSFSIEPIPLENESRKKMQWVWEPIHYRVELGNRMLGLVLGNYSPSENSGDFGVQLMDRNLATHVDRQRERLMTYLRGGGAEVTFVDNILTASH